MEVKIPYSQKEIDKLYKLQEKMLLDYLNKLNHNELKKQII